MEGQTQLNCLREIVWGLKMAFEDENRPHKRLFKLHNLYSAYAISIIFVRIVVVFVYCSEK